MKIEQINPLFPSAPVINPPLYKFKRSNNTCPDPFEPWKDPEIQVDKKNTNGDFWAFFLVSLILIVLFSRH
jgi:hypothetical protein